MRPSTKTTNLAPARTDLLGRNLELARLRELFHAGRLVTVIGTGGIGKTRLAREFGRQAVPDYPGGVWMLELAKFSTGEEALRELAEMFGVGFGGASSALQPILETLRHKPPTLLVLDNLEHLIDEIADPIARILDRTRDVQILATSREPIRIGGEQRFKLSPLGQEAAVTLFMQRAQEVSPGFQMDEATTRTVADLVDRLDRLPLAIELAASRVNVLPPAQLVDRLTSRMRALRAKERDRPERHETLAATIEWSWELLTEPQRRGLALCSVFRGGFTLDALEVVAEHDAPEDLVEDLLERSLLEFDDTERGRRFHLFEMVRSTAEQKLAEMGPEGTSAKATALADAAFARHAQYYVQLIENTPPQKIYLRRDELPNLFIAQRRATDPATLTAVVLATGRVLRLFGGARLIEDALSELLGRRDLTHVSRLLLLRAIAAREGGDLASAYSDAREAIDTATDPADAADAQIVAGRILTEQGDFDGAAQRLAQGLDLATSANAIHLEVIALGDLAEHAVARGDFERAAQLHDDAVRRARAAGDDVMLGRALLNLATVQRRLLRSHEALTNLEESLALHAKVGDDRYRALAFAALGETRASLGDAEGAFDAFTLAQEFARNLGDSAVETRALLGMADLNEGDAAARTYLIRAVKLNEGPKGRGQEQEVSPHWRDEVIPRCHLALHDLLTFQPTLARPQLRRAISLVPDARWRGLLWGYLALSYAVAQELDPAEEALANLEEHWPEPADGLDARFFRAFVTLVAAGSAAKPSDVEQLTAQLDAMRPTSATWHDHDPVAMLAKIAQRIFHVAQRTLTVSRDGRRFAPPGADDVDFSRRGPLRKIIVALAHARVARPGEGLSPDDVLEAGWPGERVTQEAGAARVYSAVRTLRTHGLEEVLLTQDDGYLIDPDVAIVWTD